MGKAKKVDTSDELKALALLKQNEKKELAKSLRENATKVMMNPLEVTSSTTMELYKNAQFDSDLDIKGISLRVAADQLKIMADEVKNGDLSSLENTLIAEVNLLHQLFCWNVRVAFNENATDRQMARYYLGLKMQEQCRKAIATLGTLKMPRQTAFIKQQNIANNQQVIEKQQITNNPPPVSENFSTNASNELLGGDILAKRMDTGALSKTIGANTEMEALGAVLRPSNTNWETKIG